MFEHQDKRKRVISLDELSYRESGFRDQVEKSLTNQGLADSGSWQSLDPLDATPGGTNWLRKSQVDARHRDRAGGSTSDISLGSSFRQRQYTVSVVGVYLGIASMVLALFLTIWLKLGVRPDFSGFSPGVRFALFVGWFVLCAIVTVIILSSGFADNYRSITRWLVALGVVVVCSVLIFIFLCFVFSLFFS